MDRLLCSVLLPLFRVVGMDRCEENVITACGHYLLAEEERTLSRLHDHTLTSYVQ
jgi:hypothetical protein